MSALKNEKYTYVGTRPVRPDGTDKVNGRALFGADTHIAGMLTGKTLRSPHAHAIIKSIDISQALALEGVFSVITRDDFPSADVPSPQNVVMPISPAVQAVNVMARDKALYHGHVVAAVAARTEAIADKALAAIGVEYEVLRPVLNVDQAQSPDWPAIEAGMTPNLSHPVPEDGPAQSANLSAYNVLKRGDVDLGFKQADVIIERTFSTPPVHQGYIEPHACLARADEAGKIHLWTTTQGSFSTRNYTALITGIEAERMEVTPSEIGGGFGGKLQPYLEPLAVLMSIKSGRPVKMVMSREDTLRATGPGPASRVSVKIGAKKTGEITAMRATMEYEGGPFMGGSMHEGQMNMFSCYTAENQFTEGYEYLINKPNIAPYRAPGLPQALLAVESVIDDIAKELKLDPIDFRLQNAVDEGDVTLYNLKIGPFGLKEALRAAKKHPHYTAKISDDDTLKHGRGVACAFYIGGSCNSNVTLQISENGKVNLLLGTVDIGGSRASMALIAAESLDVPYEDITPSIENTSAIGFSDLTGGSRVTFATGWAVHEAASSVQRQLRERAALIWDVPLDKVTWSGGHAHQTGKKDKTLSLSEIAKQANQTGGVISANASTPPSGQSPSSAVCIADTSVDNETGKVNITRFTAIQDVGTAIHPDYVEGQLQGGFAQAAGWALMEEMVYNDNGELLNPTFLDYRMPVCSDFPMIDTQIIEVPAPDHPYGIRGAGETPICAPMAAIAIAVNSALGTEISQMPMNPSRVMEAVLAKDSV